VSLVEGILHQGGIVGASALWRTRQFHLASQNRCLATALEESQILSLVRAPTKLLNCSLSERPISMLSEQRVSPRLHVAAKADFVQTHLIRLGHGNAISHAGYINEEICVSVVKSKVGDRFQKHRRARVAVAQPAVCCGA